MVLSKVDVVKRSLAAFERSGVGDVEELLEWLTEDVELRSAIVGGAEGNVYRGHEGVRRWAAEVAEALNDLHLHAEEFREVGELVVATGHVSARGGVSGLELDVPIAWVLSVRDARIATMRGYLDPDRALADARRAVAEARDAPDVPAEARDAPDVPAEARDAPDVPPDARDAPGVPADARGAADVPADARDAPDVPADAQE